MVGILKIALLLLALSTFSCVEQSFREGVIVAGGTYVPAKTLNKGKEIYAEYCMACHGEKGDGKGVAAKGMAVPPRNFKSGIIKFGDAWSGELPGDESVYKILKHGLSGTAMLPWDLGEGQMEAVWQYIKTFAPKTWLGKDKKLGEKVKLSSDPYGMARRTSAINKGREVYHITASCQSCHRGYVTKGEYSAMSKRLTGEGVSELDEDFYQTKPQESEHDSVVIPPDFTWDRVRSARTVAELANRIAAGVGGTTMAAWKDTIEDSEIWAVAYYVKHLMDMRDKPQRKELMKRLKKK